MKNIPVISVEGRSLAEAYEKALVGLYEKGTRFRTQYDKPGDPLSLDCTMNITILEPESDPMIHMAFPGGIEDLKEYVLELKGFKDHWVKNMNDINDTRWEYTYHGRLEKYGIWKELAEGSSVEKGPFKINQIESVVEKLSEQPFTRQAQMITWMPNVDTGCYDPPCLQSLWYRIIEDEEGIYWLNCNVRFRSFMNMFGFIRFNREIIANGVEKKTKRKVELARMNWHADSYHIYGKDIKAAKEMLFDRIHEMEMDQRTYQFNDEFIRQMYEDAEQIIIQKIKNHDIQHQPV
jgi:thymidylate synthase